MKQALDWDGLLASLNDDAVRLDEKGWNIFRYLSAHVGDGQSTNAGGAEKTSDNRKLSSEEARTLLLMYLKLPLERQSSLHVAMLGVAMKMADAYSDFKLPNFLRMWEQQNTAEKCIGYVDFYDERHQHYHIFDSQSRHFVAIAPKIVPRVGGYVWFVPIIPKDSSFKSAIVLRTEGNVVEARQQFGITPARVTSINKEKGYFLFQTDDDRKGLGDLKLSPRELKVGDEVRLILFLKRYSKDGEKRLYVAEMI